MPVPADLRRALRSLARRRGFAATVVLTLSLACSLPAVVLSALDRHFWRPLDLVDSERLFTLQILIEDGGFSPLSHPEYAQLRDTGAEAFSLATFGRFDFTLVAGGVPTRVNVALASGNFFTVLGARPAHGRLLSPPGRPPGQRANVAGHLPPCLDDALRSGPRVGRTTRATGRSTVHRRRRRGEPAARSGARTGLLGSPVGALPTLSPGAPAHCSARRHLGCTPSGGSTLQRHATTPRCSRRWPGIGCRQR